MALRLKWWLGGVALACLIIALAYLPPRGMDSLPFGFTFWRPPRETGATLRRNELAAAWQALDGRVQAARRRALAEPLLRAERAAGRPAKVLVLSNDSAEVLHNLMQPAFDSAWQQLELGETKIGVILANPSYTEGGDDSPNAFSWWRTYLLPDTTDRTTCVVLFPTRDMLYRQPRLHVLTQRLRSGLGPCAFYAKFGAPSPRVRRWLDANTYDVAESSDWSNIRRSRDLNFEFMETESLNSGPRGIWYDYLYQMSFNTVACLGRREAACLKAWRRGDTNGLEPFRRAVTPGERWRIGDSRLPNAAPLLAGMAKEVGDDAFQQFWTTSLPIDSALSVAVGQPAGAWLVTRNKANRVVVRLGPTPPAAATIQAILLAAAILVISAVMVNRRQVR